MYSMIAVSKCIHWNTPSHGAKVSIVGFSTMKGKQMLQKCQGSSEAWVQVGVTTNTPSSTGNDGAAAVASAAPAYSTRSQTANASAPEAPKRKRCTR